MEPLSPNETSPCRESTADSDSNGRYVAILSDGEVQIQTVDTDGDFHDGRPLPKPANSPGPVTAVALSKLRPDRVALSSNCTIATFNLDNGSFEQILAGTGRAITSLAWSLGHDERIAAGSIDGSVSVWRPDQAERPTCRLVGARGVCTSVAFSRACSNTLATVHDDGLYLWDVQAPRSSKLLAKVGLSGVQFVTVDWHSINTGRLAATTTAGELILYDVQVSTPTAERNSSSASNDTEDSDDGIFGEPDDLNDHIRLVSKFGLKEVFRQLQFCSEYGLISLTRDGKEATLWTINPAGHILQLWSRKYANVQTVQLVGNDESAVIRAHASIGVEQQPLPASVLHDIGTPYQGHEETGLDAPAKRSFVGSRHSKVTLTSPNKDENPDIQFAPVSLESIERASFAGTSRQLQMKRHISDEADQPLASLRDDIKPHKTQTYQPASPSIPSMTSSLELPKPSNQVEGDGFPMPLRSPKTFVRKSPSPRDLSDAVESTPTLAPLPPSLESPSHLSKAASENDEEDSDDDCFHAMQSSGVFMPGGINVPLRRTCSALFAPNGQLVTFFPQKAIPLPSQVEVVPPEEPTEDKPRARVPVSSLFPTFGNLEGHAEGGGRGPDEHRRGRLEGDEEAAEPAPATINFQPATSFSSQYSWRLGRASTQPLSGFERTQHKVVINVHDIDVHEVHPSIRTLASQYRIFCEENETGTQLCAHNETVAKNAGLKETACVWQLLGQILEDKVPIDFILESQYFDACPSAVIESAQSLRRSDSGVDLPSQTHALGLRGKFQWAGHAFDGAWLARKLFDWADQRADVQLLACMSVVLAEAQSDVLITNATVKETILRKLPTYAPDYKSIAPAPLATPSSTRPIPTFRAHSTQFTKQTSPQKRDSALHSTFSSQTPTPYTDSPAQTPPLLHQNSNLSNISSLSTSPSALRGNPSFSAAAKSYAQSITDRFAASTGTSPPIKRHSAQAGVTGTTGTSLSTSAEATSRSFEKFPGSWGKSVSFASSTAAVAAADVNDGYQSDRTVEDGSRPLTPKSPGTPAASLDDSVAIKFLNIGAFAPRDSEHGESNVGGLITGGSCTRPSPLLPSDLKQACVAWVQYYASLLRAWDLLLPATEIEKAAALTGLLPSTLETPQGDCAIQTIPAPLTPPASPSAPKKRRNTCTLCMTQIRGLEHVCLACGHVSHLNCMAVYEASFHVEDEEGNDDGQGLLELQCPSGCGCACAAARHELWEATEDDAVEEKESAVGLGVRRSASVTDPRSWGERFRAGEGW